MNPFWITVCLIKLLIFLFNFSSSWLKIKISDWKEDYLTIQNLYETAIEFASLTKTIHYRGPLISQKSIFTHRKFLANCFSRKWISAQKTFEFQEFYWIEAISHQRLSITAKPASSNFDKIISNTLNNASWVVNNDIWEH